MDAEPIPFELVKLLATGFQGSVYLASRSDNVIPRNIAVKRVTLAIEDAERSAEIAFLKKEIPGQLRLIHPNVVRHLHAQFRMPQSPTESASFDLIMEYCSGGTLHSASKQAISSAVLQRWTRNITEGLSYLHHMRIVHRDIKCDNVLLSHPNQEEAILKITDLGLIKQLQGAVTHRKEVSSKGTTSFMSPEMIQAQTKDVHIGRKTDIWSLGCVIVQMITGKTPTFAFKRDGNRVEYNPETALMHFLHQGGLPDVPTGIPQELDEFLRLCLQPNQDRRPLAATLLEHKFLSDDLSRWKLPAKNSS